MNPLIKKDIDPSAPVPARVEQRTGITTVQQEPDAGPENQGATEASLPHEHDQSVPMTGNTPHPEVEQAFEDLERGLQDTDSALQAHNVYRRKK
ncbi:hypothetical protein [Ottowia thiooxydans]|uniref:hypothetical protein n=1 Tax=Ottowia thiooxydans TaxID=219182 RepID=UPI0003FC9AA7|nr:hypothetical protein [Ottowia thiooxydans]